MGLLDRLLRKTSPPAVAPGTDQPAAQSGTKEGLSEFKVQIHFGPGTSPGEAADWLCYATIRAKYVTEHADLYRDQRGMVVPTFEEELQGRALLAKMCSEKAKQGIQPLSSYFSDLLRVYQAGFIAEYVWLFLSRPNWPAEAQPKQLPAFIGWMKRNLARHEVKTFGGVRIERNGPEASPTQDPLDIQNVGGDGLATQAEQVLADARAGRLVEAVGKADAIQQAAKAIQIDPGATYVCFQNQAECSFFLAGHPKVRRIRVLNFCVATAIYLKAFLLSQQQRFPEALACLEELTRLAPLMASARREQGFVLGRLGRPQESLAAYSCAWTIANRLPSSVDEAGPALRGMAVALVELGDLDRAEQLLRDSLLVEPDNPSATGELDYIARVRREGKPSQPYFIIHTRGLASTSGSMPDGLS